VQVLQVLALQELVLEQEPVVQGPEQQEVQVLAFEQEALV
tara:strand:+ start:74 stop:193 length:120 start_codon:yes stop_codon:yes gene_type:complete